MKISYRILLAILSLSLAGCIPLPTQTRLSPTSPANPSAGDGTHPAAMPVLMTGNNYAMSAEAEGAEMNVGEHGGHGAQPMKMPQHEGHEKTPAKPGEHDHHEHKAPQQ